MLHGHAGHALKPVGRLDTQTMRLDDDAVSLTRGSG
jgi:hypothetical protein